MSIFGVLHESCNNVWHAASFTMASVRWVLKKEIMRGMPPMAVIVILFAASKFARRVKKG